MHRYLAAAVLAIALSAVAVAQTPAVSPSPAPQPSVSVSPSPAPTPTPHPSVAELVRQLEDPDWDTRMEAAISIGRLGRSAHTAVDPLRKALADPEAAVRMAATNALGMIGPASQPALPLIRRGVKDPDARVRAAAVRSFPHIAHDEKDFADEARPLLSDSDEEVRYSAAVTLVAYGVDAALAAPVLRARLQGSTGTRRVHAAGVLMAALGHGPAAPEVLPALEAALDERDPWVSQAAANVIARLGSPGLPVLIARARKTDGDYRARVAAIAALARLGPAAASAVPVLKEIVAEHGTAGVVASRAITAILASPRPSPAAGDDDDAPHEEGAAEDLGGASPMPAPLVSPSPGHP